MADPALTDAIRNRLFYRLNCLAGYWFQFDRLARFCSSKNTTEVWAHLVAGDEAGTQISDVQLTRCEIGVDTDTVSRTGRIWGTLTDGGGGTGHVVNFYNDAARTVKVGAIATVDDSTAATIVPETGYTLAGTFTPGVVSGNTNFLLDVAPPPMARLADEFDGLEDEDSELKAGATTALDLIAVDLAAARDKIGGQVQRLVETIFARRIPYGSSVALIEKPIGPPNSVGGIPLTPVGLLEEIRRGMADNTGGSGVIKVQPIVASGAVAYAAAWTGRAAGPTYDDRTLAMTILGTCVKGLDTSAPRFRLIGTPSDARRKEGGKPLQAEYELTMGQTWASRKLGIVSLSIDYYPTITNTTNTPLDTTTSLWTATGLTSLNSTGGIVYARYVSASTTLFFYATNAGAAADDQDDVVASVVSPGTSSVFTAAGDAGLTIVGKTGAALANGDRGNVNFDPPVATSPADYFTIPVVVTTNPSLLQRCMARGLVGGVPWLLHGAAAPNVTDNHLKAGLLVGCLRSFGDIP